MAKKIEIEVCIIVDANGDHAVGYSDDNAAERFEEEIGGSGSRRLVKLKVFVTPPEDGEVEFDIPDDAGTTMKVEAEAAE